MMMIPGKTIQPLYSEKVKEVNITNLLSSIALLYELTR